MKSLIDTSPDNIVFATFNSLLSLLKTMFNILIKLVKNARYTMFLALFYEPKKHFFYERMILLCFYLC